MQQLIVRQLRQASMPEGWASTSGGRVSIRGVYIIVIYLHVDTHNSDIYIIAMHSPSRFQQMPEGWASPSGGRVSIFIYIIVIAIS